MSKYIRAYHKLKKLAVGDVDHLKLPKIAVIGAQSSGKSSVLEKIIGVDILPKGSKLTTRCPIIIHLNATTDSEYGIVDGGSRLSIDVLKGALKERMNSIAPLHSDIVPQKIILDLFIHNSLELTLIDLPGFTKIPVGDQPENIEAIIEDMVLEHISDTSTIILAISSANVDLANSDSLKLAKKVDPTGTRTIGVISKIDMMDKKTNCVPILRNQVFPLKLGYIGVVNRNVADLRNQLSIEDSIQNEIRYFKGHKFYRDFIPEIGTFYLRDQLQNFFDRYLQDKLPSLKKYLENELVQLEKQIFTHVKRNPTAQILIKQYIDSLNCLFLNKQHRSSYFYIEDGNVTQNLLQHFNDDLFPLIKHPGVSTRKRLSETDFVFPSTSLKLKLRERHSTIFNQQKNIEDIIRVNLANLESYLLDSLDNVEAKFLSSLSTIKTKEVSKFLQTIHSLVHKDLITCFIKIKQTMVDWIKIEKTSIVMQDKYVDSMKILLKVLYEKTQNQQKPIFSLSHFFNLTPTIRSDNFMKCTYFERDIIHDVIEMAVRQYITVTRESLHIMAMSAIESGIKIFIKDQNDKLFEEKLLYKKRIFRSDNYSNELIADLKQRKSTYKKALKILRKI